MSHLLRLDQKARVDRTKKGMLATWMLVWLSSTIYGQSHFSANRWLPDADAQLRQFWQLETQRIASDCLESTETLASWEAKRPELIAQLRQMLGLHPDPVRTPLSAVTLGVSEASGVRVERLHFQSRPGLYVTANLYLPSDGQGPWPAILYLCGHGGVKIDGVSYGNKVHYQHHGVWFARHGYACLILDSLQLGEIEGIHHGTHRYNQWWWLNRGYTPAGVEAWNCIRALDYLETRPEIDAARMGVTGRSGGGAYSWWVAALDERVKVAVPVAGITDLENHVVDGCVDGHCDCMYMVNTFGWDYPQLAALVAPRPLLISNSDRDSIFPLEGVLRVHAKAREIYRLYGADEKLGLQITAGTHQDTQELQVHAFRWMNRHLQQQESAVEPVELSVFTPSQLKVFPVGELPADEVNTRIADTFVAATDTATVPQTEAEWESLRTSWLTQLNQLTFRAWPHDPPVLDQELAFEQKWGNRRVRGFHFRSQGSWRLPWILIDSSESAQVRQVQAWVLDQGSWQGMIESAPWLSAWHAATPTAELVRDIASTGQGDSTDHASHRFAKWLDGQLERQDGTAVALILPRGIGPTAASDQAGNPVQIQRRYYLLGQTLDAWRVWDIRRTLAALRLLPELSGSRVTLAGSKQGAGWALYAALYEPSLSELILDQPPANDREGPILLNVSRFLSLDQTLAMVADRVPVRVSHGDKQLAAWAQNLAHSLDWPAESIMEAMPGDSWHTPPPAPKADAAVARPLDQESKP